MKPLRVKGAVVITMAADVEVIVDGDENTGVMVTAFRLSPHGLYAWPFDIETDGGKELRQLLAGMAERAVIDAAATHVAKQQNQATQVTPLQIDKPKASA